MISLVDLSFYKRNNAHWSDVPNEVKLQPLELRVVTRKTKQAKSFFFFNI